MFRSRAANAGPPMDRNPACRAGARVPRSARAMLRNGSLSKHRPLAGPPADAQRIRCTPAAGRSIATPDARKPSLRNTTRFSQPTIRHGTPKPLSRTRDQPGMSPAARRREAARKRPREDSTRNPPGRSSSWDAQPRRPVVKPGRCDLIGREVKCALQVIAFFAVFARVESLALHFRRRAQSHRQLDGVGNRRRGHDRHQERQSYRLELLEPEQTA